MASASEPAPTTIADDTLTAMVAVADLPSLLATLAHVCGEPQLVGSDLRLDASKHHEPQGGWSEEQQRAARAIALDKLIALRDAGWPAPPKPTAESVHPIIEWMMDSHASTDHVALLLEELGDPERDLRAQTWRLSDVVPGRDFRVAVIGAGMSGLLAAYRLRQAAIDVEVFEKNSEVGGTWLENTYPGCRVDVASHLYCYSFAQRDDWPQQFSTQPELLDYFRKFAADRDLLSSIRFDTEVKAIA